MRSGIKIMWNGWIPNFYHKKFFLERRHCQTGCRVSLADMAEQFSSTHFLIRFFQFFPNFSQNMTQKFFLKKVHRMANLNIQCKTISRSRQTLVIFKLFDMTFHAVSIFVLIGRLWLVDLECFVYRPATRWTTFIMAAKFLHAWQKKPICSFQNIKISPKI